MAKYVVTGYVKRKKKRENLTIELNYDKAKQVLSAQKKMMEKAIPKYKWVTNLKLKKIT